MSWTLAAGLLPTDLKIDANTTGSAELASCVVGKVRTWVFAGAEGGVVNTLVFRAKRDHGPL